MSVPNPALWATVRFEPEKIKFRVRREDAVYRSHENLSPASQERVSNIMEEMARRYWSTIDLGARKIMVHCSLEISSYDLENE